MAGDDIRPFRVDVPEQVLDDLRERFPVRIEVTKTPTGSTYALR